METPECQVTIHVQDRPLHFPTAADFIFYVDDQRREGGYIHEGSGEWVETWHRFEHLTLVKIVDDRTGECFVYSTFIEFPETSIMNQNNDPVVYFGELEPAQEQVALTFSTPVQR